MSSPAVAPHAIHRDYEGAKLGMWLFLFTEILLFGGLFILYSAYRARYPGSDPSPYALLGYEAMKLGLSTIAGLGQDGDSKSAVLSALFATANRHSVLGTYDFDRYGDTTLRSIGLYKVGPTGNPTYVRTLTPAHVL